MKRHSSDTSVRDFNYLTAAVLSGFAQIPVSSNRCPRNLILVLDNSHFCGLRTAPPDWVLSSAASKLMSCSAWVLPKISLSSMWHTTPFDPVRILFILSWKCSGALDILKGGWSPWYSEGRFVKIVASWRFYEGGQQLGWWGSGICQNLLLASTCSLLNTLAPVNWVSVVSNLGIGCTCTYCCMLGWVVCVV